MADEIRISGGGVVEEGGVPLLCELHGEANSRVESIAERGGTRVGMRD